MRRWFVIAGVVVLAAMVAAVLLVHGADVEGLRAAIRATARTSALCLGFALARVRGREFGVLLPVSQAMHYVLIILSPRELDPAAIVVGVIAMALMVWNALRPNAVALWVLWFAFLAANGQNRGPSWVYKVMIGWLVLAAIVRLVTRPSRPAPPRSPADASGAAPDPSSTHARA